VRGRQARIELRELAEHPRRSEYRHDRERSLAASAVAHAGSCKRVIKLGGMIPNSGLILNYLTRKMGTISVE
jgi:hypothetical protein